jgi:signal transduction histidine kinase
MHKPASTRADARSLARAGTPEEHLRRIELILSTIDELPTLSAVAVQVLAWGAAGDVDIDAGAQLIESDPALAARILALCARADKGLAAKVSSVKHAVVLLGVETVRGAALSVAVFDLLRNAQQPASDSPDDGRGFDREEYWRFCVGTGAACEALARAQASTRRDVRPTPTGQAFLAGLLSGLGRIALAWALPSAYDRVVRLARVRGCATSEVERELLGIDHHAAARRLAQRWGLPSVLSDCMWLHDAPREAVASEHAELVTLVSAGRAIARSLALGDACDANEHATSAQACASAGLSVLSAAQIESLCEATRELFAHRVRVLGLGERTSQQQLAQSLARATQRLTQTASAQARALAHAEQGSRALAVAGALARASHADWTIARAGATLLAALGAPAAVLAGSRHAWRAWQTNAPAERQGASLVLPQSAPTTLESCFVPGAPSPMLSAMPWLLKELEPLLAALGSDGTNPDASLRLLPFARCDEVGFRLLVIAQGSTLDQLAIASDATSDATSAAQSLLAQAARNDDAREAQEKLVSLQRELVASQAKATHAESMVRLGQTTAGAAHEMNTPLAVIVGRAQLLLTRLRDERDKAAVQAIAGSARQISDLIASLHVLSTPPTPTLAPTALRDVIDQAIVAAQGRLCSDVAVRVELGKEGSLYGMTDGALLARVLTELLTNALEACPKGPVSVHARWGEALGSERFDAIFEVRDEGRGPSETALMHAFDPFYSERPSGRGKGLGLSRARAIVQALGGNVRLISAQNIGQARGAVALVRVPMQRLDKPGLLANRVK